MAQPLVSIIMGSQSDAETLRQATSVLKTLNISFEMRVVSAHRTPERLYDFAKNAEQRGIRVIIAGAGGAAHLPGMTAALTTLPVIAVPVKSRALNGIDSLLSIVQMPKGIPVATFAIGEAGAANAALFAAALLAAEDAGLASRLEAFRSDQQQAALNMTLPPAS